MKKLATKLNSFDWSMDQLPKLFWTPIKGSAIYADLVGKEIRLKVNKCGKLYLIRTTYSDHQVFMQFSGLYGDDSKDVVVLLALDESYKVGSVLPEYAFVELL